MMKRKPKNYSTGMMSWDRDTRERIAQLVVVIIGCICITVLCVALAVV